jgi:hypothetical protein
VRLSSLVMNSDAETTSRLEETLERLLGNAFSGRGRVALVGASEDVARLEAAQPDRFVAAERLEASPPPSCEVLALGLDAETLGRAREVARAPGFGRLFVLADGPGGPDVRDRLHAAGLALAGLERLFWQRPPAGAPPGGSRAERLAAETRSILYRCVLDDDARAVGELEAAVQSLQRQLDLLAQVEVDHARTREAERARAERLDELEELIDHLGGQSLLDEVERLRAEIKAMRATRVWRMGTRWWALRDRVRSRPAS